MKKVHTLEEAAAQKLCRIIWTYKRKHGVQRVILPQLIQEIMCKHMTHHSMAHWFGHTTCINKPIPLVNRTIVDVAIVIYSRIPDPNPRTKQATLGIQTSLDGILHTDDVTGHKRMVVDIVTSIGPKMIMARDYLYDIEQELSLQEPRLVGYISNTIRGNIQHTLGITVSHDGSRYTAWFTSIHDDTRTTHRILYKGSTVKQDTWIDRRRHGYQKVWQDGRLTQIANYAHGELHGRSRAWTPTGELICDNHFKRGRHHGPCVSGENGKIAIIQYITYQRDHTIYDGEKDIVYDTPAKWLDHLPREYWPIIGREN